MRLAARSPARGSHRGFKSPSDTHTEEISLNQTSLEHASRLLVRARGLPPVGSAAPSLREAAMTAPLIAPLSPRAPGRAAASTPDPGRFAACLWPSCRKSRRSPDDVAYGIGRIDESGRVRFR